jgi:type IV secretory pathway VirJ component
MLGPILLLLAAATVTGMPETSMADLPLVEVPATAPRAGRLAVMLSGDGGWSALDKHVASTFAAHGIDVVGLNSLKYLWKERLPEEVAQDVESIARHYMASWKDTDKTESLCTALAPPAQVFRVDGGHHFGGDYDGLAEKILGAIP